MAMLNNQRVHIYMIIHVYIDLISLMFVSILFTFVVMMTEASYRSTIRYSNRTSEGYDSPSFRCCPSSAKLPYKILSYNYQLAIVIVIIIITINNTHTYIPDAPCMEYLPIHLPQK